MWRPDLPAALPIRLGSGVTVRNVSSVSSGLELDSMGKYTSQDEREQINRWTIALVHEFTGLPGLGDEDNSSEIFTRYVAAHIRLICPTKMNGRYVQGYFAKDGAFHLLGFSSHVPQIFIEDCELFAEVSESDLQAVGEWLPWIITLKEQWRDFYPLYLSLYLSEKAYVEEDGRVRHLLRVMALEALFDSEHEFGAAVLTSRLKAFLGRDTDLYAKYADIAHHLPVLPLRSVIGDMCDLRNKIAHGIPVPDHFRKARTYGGDSRFGSNHQLTHEDVLREAATSLVSLSWQRILKEGLQPVFADKSKMRALFGKPL
jgi:hypothetical protein